MADTNIVSYRTYNKSEIKNAPIIKGSIIVAKDTGEMFADTIDGDRVPISKQVTFTTDAARQALLAPEEELLYITVDDFKIWIWYEGAWQCLTREVKFTTITNEQIDAIVNANPVT